MMKLLLIALFTLMLMSCNTEKQLENNRTSSDSTEVNRNTSKPDIPDSLPPNAAKVILKINTAQPGSADSLKKIKAVIKNFIRSGSSTPVLTMGERITLKISSGETRNSIYQAWRDDSSPTLEAIIKHSPTIDMSPEKSNQTEWSLVQVNKYQ